MRISNSIKNLLEVSTAHMPDSDPDFGELSVAKGNYGYVVWVIYPGPDDNGKLDPSSVPGWLMEIMKIAVKEKCILISFDRDADEINELKRYDW